MGDTMAQKVLARVAGRDSVSVHEFVTGHPDKLMCHEALGLCFLKLRENDVAELHDPDRILVVLDHYFPAPTERMARAHTMIRQLCELYGIKNFLGYAGVCHQVLTEQGHVRPGDLILGTDSHSCTYGGIGAAGAGIGITEMAYVLATGELWLQVPPTIKFELKGQPGPALMSKDIILHIAGTLGTEIGQYKSLEFAGPLASQLSIASRLTIANMGVELGAKFALFEADEKTVAYLGEITGDAVEPFGPDEDAAYEETHTIDVTGMEPQVARPHSPGNAGPVSECAGQAIDQAYLGSCTNGRLEDLAVAAGILKGRKVDPKTRMLVTPASHEVALEATKAGYMEIFLEAGAHVTAAGCGACPGGHGGVLGPGETCISSTNRNFQGRMGSPEAKVYLASPATVAASAVAGRITDPREFETESLIEAAD